MDNQGSLHPQEEGDQSPRSSSHPTLQNNPTNPIQSQTQTQTRPTSDQPPLPPYTRSSLGEYSPTSPPSGESKMSTPPDISSASASGSDEQLDLAQASASRLGLPLQRPSLGSTPSTEPLISPGDISPSTTPVANPFSAATASTGQSGRGSASQAKGLTVNVGGGGSANPFGGSNRSSRSSISNPSPTAPKIRINDMPNSPPSEDVSQAPTPPAVPDAAPTSAGGTGFTSPFANRSSNLRNSINSIPASPTNKRASNGSTTSALGGAGVVSASGVEVGSGKNNIAARRALRMKQAQSTDSKANRYSNYTHPNKNAGLNRKAFQSTRLKGEIYKPWLEQKDPALRWARWITIGSIVMGFAIAAVICWDGYRSVPKLGKVCNLINEDFSSGSIDSSIFQHEVRLDGYGYGSFQWTTNDAKNSYVKDGVLYIVPTLTSDDIGVDAITNGHTVNLTADGTCTSTNVSNCVAVSNSSQLTIINPVKTARLITKNSHSIKYGKVEVKAKFPTGDWLWPRISMLPVNNTYGAWPRSGQINILGGRGNNATYDARGVDYAQSDLHWGPTVDLDRQYLTWGYREQRRTYYSQKYHTFGLEWNDQFMWTYIDSRVAQVISYRFNKESFWSRGKFPTTYTNNTEVIKLINPWLASSENNAPFDQPFYLMIDLAVGSQDGWFPDGTGGKPWIDQSGSAMSDFWAAKSKWWDSSWTGKGAKDEDRAFAIESVKMWEKC